MAAKTGTYTLIASTTLNANTQTVTFSSIPQTYTDLVLISSVKSTGNYSSTYTINNDSGTNYSYTYMNGNGTTATSGRMTSTVLGIIDNWAQATSQTMFDPCITQFMDYANTTTYKTILCSSGSANLGVERGVNLWRNTSAINTITLSNAAGNFVSGSTFRLFGIEAGNL